MSRYAVQRQDGMVAHRNVRHLLCWVQPGTQNCRLLTWETDKGATLFSSMNGGKVKPVSELEVA